MDPEIAARIDSLNAIIWTLAALVLALFAMVVRLPEEPKSKAVEFCKLHSRPVSECRNQHGDD